MHEDVLEKFLLKYSSENTRNCYRIGIRVFLRFSGWSINELPQAARDNYMMVEVRIIEWVDTLRRRGLAPRTMVLRLLSTSPIKIIELHETVFH